MLKFILVGLVVLGAKLEAHAETRLLHGGCNSSPISCGCQRDEIVSSLEIGAKPSVAPLSESIRVIDLSKKIEPPPALGGRLQNLDQLILSEIGRSDQLAAELYIRGHNISTIARGVEIGKWKVRREWIRLQTHDTLLLNVVSRRLSTIHHHNVADQQLSGVESEKIGRDNRNISSQLAFSRQVSAFNELFRGAMQEPSGTEKEESEGSNKRVSDFKPVTKERRPKFGSFLLAVLGMGGVFLLADRAADLWSCRRRLLSGVLFALALALIIQSTAGFLLGLDIWSLIFGA